LFFSLPGSDLLALELKRREEEKKKSPKRLVWGI